ncbi:cell division protein CrgA [Nocardioides bigeumensis]|uniref:Cell division protein CrgA n=1 Tax=Nocardioides bigeumensis TaxID=433657 RepID=A0ABP5KR78_9ACTN
MARTDSSKEYRDPTAGPTFSVRFVIALVLMALGIAWIAYYYLVVRVDPSIIPAPEAGGPKLFETLTDWKGFNWNYVGGFALVFIGLALTAHPSTPLGRGRGVVVGMLGCFLIGLIWICTYYVVSDDPNPPIPVLNDLGNYNLVVGIAFMAVGFTFATRWE